MREGFSLVELSIAVVISGLMMGAVGSGLTMVQEARIKQVVSSLSEFEAAFQSFENTFSAIPGDFDRASTFWANCAENNANCNGNGNGVIEHGSDAQTDEIAAATRHLNLAQLIRFNGGVIKNSFNGALRPGQNIEGTNIFSSGYFFSGGRSYISMSANYLAPFVESINAIYIGKELPGNSPVAGGLTPLVAHLIDKKLDGADSAGGALTGRVRAKSGMSFAASDCADGDVYNISSINNSCLLGLGLGYIKNSMDEEYKNGLLQIAQGVMNPNALLNIANNNAGNNGPGHIVNNGNGGNNGDGNGHTYNPFTGGYDDDQIDESVDVEEEIEGEEGEFIEPEGVIDTSEPPPQQVCWCWWIWCWCWYV